MAKISIHIPDEVLDRVREYKDRINISRICSTALLKEVKVISDVPPMVEQTRKLISRLRGEIHRSELDSFNLGVKLAQDFLGSISLDQLRAWGTMSFSSKRSLVFPEAVEDFIEQGTLENRFSSPFHRPSFAKGWLSVMRRTWETVNDKV